MLNQNSNFFTWKESIIIPKYLFYKASIIKLNYVEEINFKTVYKTKQTIVFYAILTLEISV